MNNNNWLKSIAKTYIQLNENSDNPVSQRARDNPNQTDMRGGPYPSIVRGVERQFEREGIISQGVLHPEVIENHGSPFNEDGSVKTGHIVVQNSLEKARTHLGSFRDPLEQFVPHLRITPRMVDGVQKGYFISVMERPQSSPQPPLNEARKMKPTATDRANNRRREQEAIAAHLAAANAITSIPGARALKKYPGQMFHGDEDPEHSSILAHLADKAPTITDPVAAIRLVAPHHGVDPEAAIAALPSSAPMSPQDFMKAMRR